METTAPATSALPDAALDQLFRDARTVNAFTDEPVSIGEIEEAYELAKWGPTAMNSSPLRLAIITPGAERERLVRHVNPGNQAKTLAAPLTLIVAADPRFHDHLGTLAPHREGAAAKLEPDLEVRVRMATKNTWLQAGYLILALRSLGLAVGPMGGFAANGVDEEFFAHNGWQSLLLLNVGRAAADGGVRPRAPRLSADTAILVR